MGRGTARAASGLSFTPVPPNTLDAVTVPPGYRQSVVIRWGDPVLPGAPGFDVNHQSAAAQEKQFGYNNDYVALLPLSGPHRALMWANHEYTNEELMFHGWVDGAHATEEQLHVTVAAHGASVVEVRRSASSGQWRPVATGRRPYNRRITAKTPMALTGPASGSDLLKTAADPEGRTVVGMVGNCSGGVTPWGTVLTCEENFNFYFVGGYALPDPMKPAYERYGIDVESVDPGYGRWDRIDERFDLSKHPHEANRFGWVVEVDPYDPDFTPRKRTALGRIKHEAANMTITSDGRVAVYMGDDERFEYLYKFLSAGRFRAGGGRAAREHNLGLLDDGTLYVARFSGDSPASEIDGSGRLPSDGAFDGVGAWIPLASGSTSHVSGMTAEEVYVHTRAAADRVGATKMDRPEDVEVNPVNGRVYAALANNSARTPSQADEANPRANSKHGHVIELIAEAGDHGSARFTWNVFLICGDPQDPSTYFAGCDRSQVSPISCPDNLTFDRAGNLWLATDGNQLGGNDGIFAVPVEGPDRGRVRQFLTVPRGAEATGPTLTDDRLSLLVAVQHPGEIDGSTADQPASTWPDGGVPRPAVVCVWHARGLPVGGR